MEPIKDRFCMLSDKELTLQILSINNIPAVELADAKTCSYPIVGRMYGHNQGEDIAIVHTKDQALEEGFDYFTKLYVIEKEYLIEVQGLSVKRVQEAIAHQVVIFDEIPTRTELYGWSWEDVDSGSIPTEWLDMAIRALYVTGLTNGFVKIGTMANDSAIVIDVNSPSIPISIPAAPPKLPFTMGADVEFMLSCDGELLPTSDFFPVEGPVGCDERQIEQDSGEYALAEIRPEKAESPHELFGNIKKLLSEASEKIPYENIELRAGSMPFAGYQCGGHIHFGIPQSLSLLRALDHYLAVPLAMIEDPRTSKRRRRTKHGGLGRYRIKPYGFEYLSLSSWIIDPDLTLSVLCLAHLVAAHHHELPSDFLFHPLVQRAYYQGNQIFLKQFWGDIKKRLMNTSSYSLYERELSILFARIEEGNPFAESSDIRRNWGMTVPKQSYDLGLIIQIPKKTRIKFNLTEGQTTYVRAGKSISPVTIRPYPFSFRNSSMVQLSPSLRNVLSLPKDWYPKISFANGVLTLGPVMGILANRPFDRQATYFQHLFRLAKEKQMLVYVFEPRDIDWDQKVVRGTSIDGDGLFPFPAVIYDRYFYKHDYNKKLEVDEIRFKLQSIYNIPFINSPALFHLTGDKWLSYQVLSRTHEEHLPDTRLLENLSDITEMLDRYGEVFLKPLAGSLSKGVIRVIRRPTGIFWMNSKQPTFQPLTDMEELVALLSSLQKKSPYLVQEGIQRKQLKGNYVEIRVYMQKNGKQKWVRTGMVTRLTNEGVMTEETEINMRLSQVLKKLYSNPNEQREIRNQLAKIARDVAETVEEETGTFGELAVDLFIDQYDSIKILEINAKPDSLFSQIRAYKLRNLAGLRLLNYAALLAGYESEEI
ncbi:putative amidoligase domain-containing protein [Ectobacillus panaciterrae]|uniref:putative amidoligase domain-containing protein n=1 Tax=Ectobacillus panaciterrae TaxID=363872 RepID=UPI000428487E